MNVLITVEMLLCGCCLQTHYCRIIIWMDAALKSIRGVFIMKVSCSRERQTERHAHWGREIGLIEGGWVADLQCAGRFLADIGDHPRGFWGEAAAVGRSVQAWPGGPGQPRRRSTGDRGGLSPSGVARVALDDGVRFNEPQFQRWRQRQRRI